MISHSKKALAAVGTVALLGLAGEARAAVVLWTNAAAGNWNDPANWNNPTTPGALPAPPDDARISNGGTATLDTNQTVGSVTVADATGTSGNLIMTGGALTTTNTDIRIGGNGNATGGTGTFTQSGGAVNMNAGNLNLGLGTLANGTYNMSGGSLQINSANIIAVANRGNGTLNMSGGTIFIRGSAGTVASAVLNVGRNVAGATANGSVTLSGGTIASPNVRFGNAANSTASVNTFNLLGTGTLLTDLLTTFAGHGGSNTFDFTGGTLTAENLGMPLTNNGGKLAPANIDFTAAATAAVADISQLPINPIGSTVFSANNSYIQGPAGTLAIDIAGPGSNDLVDIGAAANIGTATLAGTIAVNLLNGYDPALGTTFDVLTADTITSTALPTGLTPSGNGFSASVITGGGADGRDLLRVTVVEVPEPATFTLLGIAGFGLLGRRSRRKHAR
jgi:PEP-CTERM motif